MFHDENVYDDPFTFKPERFLKDGQLDPKVKTPEAAFGFGRRYGTDLLLSDEASTDPARCRICPGRHLASNTMFLTIASVLAVFNIEKAIDEDGKVITPCEEYSSGPIWSVYRAYCRPCSPGSVAGQCRSSAR
jgi:cytochrome P450